MIHQGIMNVGGSVANVRITVCTITESIVLAAAAAAPHLSLFKAPFTQGEYIYICTTLSPVALYFGTLGLS